MQRTKRTSLPSIDVSTAVLHVTDYIIILLDAEGYIQNWNKGMFSILGYKKNEIIGKHFSLLFTDEDKMKGKPERELMHAATHGKGEDENWMCRKDGSRIWVSGLTTPIYDQKKNVVAFTKIARDSSERKANLEKLKESEQKYRLVVENSSDMINIIDSDGTILYSSPTGEDLTGYTRDQVLQKSIFDFIHPEDRKKVKNALNAALQGKLAFVNHFRLKTIHRTWVHMESTGKGILNNNEVLVIAISRDISKRKKYEEVLEASELRYRTMIEQSPLSVQILSPSGETVQVNKAWKKLWGLELEDMKGYNILKDKQLIENGIMPYIKKGLSGKAVAIPSHKYAPGNTHDESRPKPWTRAFLYSVKDAEGKIRELVLIHEDITAQKKAQEELLKSEIKFRRIVEANMLGIAFWNIDGTILQANDEFLRMTGYTRKDLREHKINWSVMTPKEYTEVDEQAIDEMMKTGVASTYEKEVIRKDGSHFPILIGRALLEQSIRNGVAFILDITERKEVEKRKDEFMSIASHELKTPLTTIKAFAQILKREFEYQGNKTAIRYLSKMDTQLDKLTTLIYDLLDVSKIATGKMDLNEEVFDFDELIDETIEDMRATGIRHRIDKLGTVHKRVFADKYRINQVLINLIANAVKYSPQKDKVDIRVSASQDYVKVSVKDYGIGIPKKSITKIFDRFYRVQDKKRESFPGFGLGLYISSEIVKRHGGKMWVESEENMGSTFHFSLPITLHKKIHENG